MNKLFAVGVLTLSLATPAMADTFLGLYAGAQTWNTAGTGGFADNQATLDVDLDEQMNNTYYVALEHFVPLLPNIKIAQTKLAHSGSASLTESFDFLGSEFTVDSPLQTHVAIDGTDFIAYYEFLDFDAVSLDLGLNLKQVEGSLSANNSTENVRQSFDTFIPMIYGKVQLGLPLSSWSAYVEGSHLAVGASRFSDLQAVVQYQLFSSLAVELDAQLGYRRVTVNLEDVDGLYLDTNFDGVFAGVQVHF